MSRSTNLLAHVERTLTAAHHGTDLDRRAMLGALLVLPFGVFLVQCSSSGSSGGYTASGGGNTAGSPPAAAPQKTGTQVVYSSSNVSAHFHTFGLELAVFTNPPEAAIDGSTSTSAGHAHSVSVSVSDLQDIDAGQTVLVTTGEASGHAHVFTFLKISS